MSHNTQPILSPAITTDIQKMGYAIADGFKTHSSLFFTLSKNDKEYLLKLDQTCSGSLIHQEIYSKNQRETGLHYIPVAYLDNQNRYIILEKLNNYRILKNILNEEYAEFWGNTMSRIHQHTYKEDTYRLWVDGYDDFMRVKFQDTIEEYIRLAEIRLDSLSYEQEYKVRTIITFIRDNIERYRDDPVLTHGDPHINNTMIHNKQVLIYDPNGTVLYGSRYIDLAIVALDFPAYFSQTIENSSDNDRGYLSQFFKGYGDLQ